LCWFYCHTVFGFCNFWSLFLRLAHFAKCRIELEEQINFDFEYTLNLIFLFDLVSESFFCSMLRYTCFQLKLNIILVLEELLEFNF
jgi:hypothetical protein